jgi:predicted  nucleic acid-binding Zn-ribbon protein
MEVKEQIDILVELQKNDTDAERARTLLSGISEKQRAVEEKLASAAAAREEAEADLEGLRKDYRALESDLKVNLDLIRKSKSLLPGVKSNKEYQALLKQVEEMEKKNSRVEDDMLALLDRIEAGEKALEQRKQDCLLAEEAFKAEKVRLEEEVRKGEMHLDELTEGRDRIARSAPPDLLETFARTQNLVGSPMIVPVRGTTCEGCNMSIPPQLANELRRFESLNFCPFCNRLIYWERPLD